MPTSKGRKPKPPAQPSTTKEKPPNRTNGRWGRFITALGILLGIVGLVALLPDVTIEPSNAPEASNPFSGAFKVRNDQFYPIEHVHIQAYVWCVKMGTGTDTTPPSTCKKGNIPSSRPEWNQDIAGHDSRDILAGEVLYGTPHALLYAEISIEVSYRPWFVPIPLEREDHFYTRRKDDGNIEWLTK
jgi:hypothetical protein